MNNIIKKVSSTGLGSKIYTLIAFFGGYIVNTFLTAIKYTAKGIRLTAVTLWQATHGIRRSTAVFFKKICVFLLRPVVSFFRYSGSNAKALEKIKEKKWRQAWFYRSSFIYRKAVIRKKRYCGNNFQLFHSHYKRFFPVQRHNIRQFHKLCGKT